MQEWGLLKKIYLYFRSTNEHWFFELILLTNIHRYLVKIQIRERPIIFNPTQKAKYVPKHKSWKDLEKSQEILSLDSTMYIPIRPKHYTYLCDQSQFISSNSRIFDMSALSEFMMCPLIIGTPIHQFNHRAGHSRGGGRP